MENIRGNYTPKQVLMADMALVLVSFIWGAGIPMSAILARNITPLWAIALRMLLAAMFLLVIYRKKIITSTKRDWQISSIQTLILVGTFIFMTFGLTYSTASKQAFIGGIGVLMVPFFVWILYKKRPRAWIFLGTFITTIGIMVMGFTPGMEFNFGDLLSFFMAIFYAFQVLGAGYCARRVDPERLVALHIMMLGVILTIIALIFEPIPDIRTFSPLIWGTLLCVSLMNTIFCFVIQFKAQKITSETHAAVIYSLEGLFGYIVAVLIGQDPFIMRGAVGGLIIVTGMLIVESESFIKDSADKFLGNR